MKLFGFELTRAKTEVAVIEKAVTSVTVAAQLAAIFDRGWMRIQESFAGAWQRNVEITVDNVTTHPAVFSCTTLIQNDVAKCRPRLVQEDDDGIWTEVEAPAFSPVLRRPNRFQNRIQFYASWMLSKLLHGNTYVIKLRDERKVVIAMYILDPTRCRPLVAPNGDVFYELKRDDLSKLPDEQYIVPATEIIHDRWNCLFHPLVGLSPIYAAGLAAVQGLNIQTNSTTFFGNGANPGGVITVPGAIDPDAAGRVKTTWETGFSGDNAGKVAVLADGMTYTPMKQSAVDSEVIKQLQWTDEVICACYHVPAYMAGFGPAPLNNNVEAATTGYYTQALQIHFESIELCLDEGLGLTEGEIAAKRYGTEFDLDDLLRMDTATLMTVIEKGKNVETPNEQRKRLNRRRVAGGDTVYRQQQEFSLEALSKRDARPDPFSPTPAPAPPALPAAAEDDEEKAVALFKVKAFELGIDVPDRMAA